MLQRVVAGDMVALVQEVLFIVEVLVVPDALRIVAVVTQVIMVQ